MIKSQDDNTNITAKKPAQNWCKHDIDSRLVPEMQVYILKTGAAGYGFFWAVVEEMYRTNKPEQNLTKLNTMGAVLGLSDNQCSVFVEAAISSGVWSRTESGIISSRAQDEIEDRTIKLNEIKEKRKEAGEESGRVRRAKRNKPEQTGTNTNQSRLDQSRLDNINTYTNSQPEQIPAPLTLGASPPPKTRTKKIKPKLNNLIESTEEELIAKGLDPSKPAPKNLTRKKESLIPQDLDSRVWMTNAEAQKLIGNWGPEKVYELFNNLSEYLGMKPEKAAEYADHYLTILNWEKRNANK